MFLNICNILICFKGSRSSLEHLVKFQFSICIMSCIILWYHWFVSLYLYTVNITVISYCRIVYLNHIFHCNPCNAEIKKWMNEWMNEWSATWGFILSTIVVLVSVVTLHGARGCLVCYIYLILYYCCEMRWMTLGSKA